MMDRTDRDIDAVLKLSAEQNKEQARLRRNARDREAEIERMLDNLEDRCALRFPIRKREELPQLSDQAYAAYITEAIRNRTALLWTLIGIQIKRAMHSAESAVDAECDRIMGRNCF
jgi:hypothetical protein